MTTPASVLRKAKELIETKGWTQGALGKRADGSRIHWGDYLAEHAVCFCPEGAIFAAAGSFHDGALVRLQSVMGGPDRAIWQWNDMPGRQRSEVLAAFDKAILLAEEEGRK